MYALGLGFHLSVPLDGLQSFEYHWMFGVLQLDLHNAPVVNELFLAQAICSGICFLVQVRIAVE
jgi:hypothetical protein